MKSITLTFFAVLSAVTPVLAQSREVVQNCKAATALVDLSAQQKIATGFCIDDSGVFVTNFHVVDEVDDDEQITLVLNASQDSERKVKAKVIRTDEENDLALMRVESPGPFQALKMGEESELFETMQTVVFGFPFGKGLSVDEDSFPAISINVGRITALRRSDNETKLIQLDAAINPGNSGGAVTDEQGRVIGVVSFGLLTTGVNFAIPVNKLKQLMRKPDVNVTYPTITSANLDKSVNLDVTLAALLTPLKNPSISAEIKIDKDEPLLVPLKRQGMKFHASFVPQPLKASKPVLVDSQIRFSGGEITGRIEDRKIGVDAKQYDLSSIASITAEDDGNHSIELTDGTTQTGKATGLNAVEVDFGDTRLNVDISKAAEISLDPVENTDPQVSFTIVVKDGNTEVERIESGSEQSSHAIAAGQFKKFVGPDKQVAMPGTISDVVVAKGGRLLLLPMPQQKKLAVFDCSVQKVISYISMASDNCLVAGTLENAVIFDRTNNVIERWSLDTFKRERSIKPPFSGVVKAVAAGSAARGPILVLWAVGTGALDRAKYTTIDVATMTEKEIETSGRFHHSYRDAMHIRASSNGRVFGMWCTSHSPQGMHAAILLDGKLTGTYEHNSVGHIVPGPDGMMMFTGIGGVFTNTLKAKSQGSRTRVPCVPTSHPKLYLTVPAEPGAQRNLGSKPFAGVRPGIHSVDSSAALVDLPSLQLGSDKVNRSWSASDFSLDKRVHYILQGNALITIPFSNDKIIVQEFDLMKELEQSDTDYFFVTSTPNPVFSPGSKWKYKLTAASKQRGFRYEVASGPKGMKVSRTGEVTWSVPRDFREETVDVIINVSNKIDQTGYDTFTLYKGKAD